MLTCPLIVLTLGLFTLVINALTLWISSTIAQNWFNVYYTIDGFWSALWGALIVSVVSVVLSVFVQDDKKDRKKHKD
jgi:putative membrane protein